MPLVGDSLPPILKPFVTDMFEGNPHLTPTHGPSWTTRQGSISNQESPVPGKRKFSERAHFDSEDPSRALLSHPPELIPRFSSGPGSLGIPYMMAMPRSPVVPPPPRAHNTYHSPLGVGGQPAKQQEIHETIFAKHSSLNGSPMAELPHSPNQASKRGLNDTTPQSSSEIIVIQPSPTNNTVQKNSAKPLSPASHVTPKSTGDPGAGADATFPTLPKVSRNSVPVLEEFQEKPPLKLKVFRQHMQDILKEVERDHSDCAASWLARAADRADIDRIVTYRDYVPAEKVSPFAKMDRITSHRLPKSKNHSKEQVFAHYVPSEGHPKGEDSSVVYSTQTILTSSYVDPPFTHYVSSSHNILVEGIKQRTFLPYLGENDDNLDADYKALQTKILTNQDKTRGLIDGEEFGSIWLPYIHPLLSKLGTSVKAVLKFLIDIDVEKPPKMLTPDLHDILKEHEEWISEGFYEEEDDLEATRGDGEEKPKRPQKQWVNALANLSSVGEGENGERELAAAVIACHTFMQVIKFSIWHVVRQTPEAKLVTIPSTSKAERASQASKPVYSHPFINIACLVCKKHSCFEHGEYAEKDDEEDVRFTMTSGLDALQLTATSKRDHRHRPDKGAHELQALLGRAPGGAIVGEPWTVLSTDAPGFDLNKPCSDECFWNIRNRVPEKIGARWSREETDMLETVGAAYYSQKRGACAIAQMGIVNKSCVEIFNRLVRLVPSAALLTALGVDTDRTVHKNKPWSWWLHNKVTWKHHQREPFRPCNHVGKCKDNPDCSCDKQGISCEKNCNCPQNCSRRFRGCQCAARGKPCFQSENCDCFKLNRECDPDICQNCGAAEVLDPCNRYDETILKGRCSNLSIQRALPKRTQLGQSKLLAAGDVTGYGLFMGEEVKKGEYIGEYVGEIVTTDEAEQRGIIYNAMNLSYLFDLNKKQVLDSTPIGNKLRYINHQGDDFANCQAKVMFCGGVQRIGMFATKNIDFGEELLFNYGNAFASKIDMVTMHKDGTVTVEKATGRAGGGDDSLLESPDARESWASGAKVNLDGDQVAQRRKTKASSKAKRQETDVVYASDYEGDDDFDDGSGIGDEDEDDSDLASEEGINSFDEDDTDAMVDDMDDDLDDGDHRPKSKSGGSKSKSKGKASSKAKYAAAAAGGKKTTGGSASAISASKRYVLANGMSGSDRMRKAWIKRYANLGMVAEAQAQKAKYEQSIKTGRFGSKMAGGSKKKGEAK